MTIFIVAQPASRKAWSAAELASRGSNAADARARAPPRDARRVSRLDCDTRNDGPALSSTLDGPWIASVRTAGGPALYLLIDGPGEIRAVAKAAPVEGERFGVAVQARHESGDRMPLDEAHAARGARLEQGLIALLLRVELRVGAPVAQRGDGEARPRRRQAAQ